MTRYSLSPATLAALAAPRRSPLERLRDGIVAAVAVDPFAGVGLSWEEGLPVIADEPVLPEFK
jgi:hypothetical protein